MSDLSMRDPVTAARFLNLAFDAGPQVLKMALDEVLAECGDHLHDWITVDDKGVSVDASRMMQVLEPSLQVPSALLGPQSEAEWGESRYQHALGVYEASLLHVQAQVHGLLWGTRRQRTRAVVEIGNGEEKRSD